MLVDRVLIIGLRENTSLNIVEKYWNIKVFEARGTSSFVISQRVEQILVRNEAF